MARRFPQQPPSPVQEPANTSGPAVPSDARPSPFASGPVAMLHQGRPSFGGPGQFPGHAVRTTPTQLSTPLVPQRHRSASVINTSSESTPSLFTDRPPVQPEAAYDVLKQAAPPSAIDLFGQTAPSSSQRYRSSTNPFSSPTGPAPPFPIQQTHSEVPGEANQTLPDDLFGPSSSPGQPSQQSAFTNLFGSPEKKVPAPGLMSSRHSHLISSQSPMSSPFSRLQPPPRSTQEYTPYQQQQSSMRPFGATPPPAAPFLGYGDKTRLQSLRASVPSATTPEVLIPNARNAPSPTKSTSSAATAAPSPSAPRIALEAPSSDDLLDDFLRMPVDERFAGAENVTPPASKLLIADIPDTVEELEVLYAQKRWKSLTKKSLSMLQSPSKDINVTLEIKSWWLAGLIKEGHYDNAASVLDQIGNLDEISVASGATPFVPIRLLLLQALLSKCQGKSMNHEKQLFHLNMRLQSAIQKNETMSLLGVKLKAAARWLRITQFALANHLVHQQKFVLALRICSQIDVQCLDDTEKVVVLSRVGRIRLQMGDLAAADKLFEAARHHTSQVKTGIGNGAAVEELEARLLLNDGLLFFAQNKLQEALGAFESILCMQNTQVSTSTKSDAELFLDEDVVHSAVNNYAICALYCCDVKAAIAALERMIRSNPQRFLNGVVVFNLSSLYDLQFDNATSKSRKEMMMKIAHLYDLEHIDPAAYRI